MKQIGSLTNLEIGEYAKVIWLNAVGAMRRRLQDIGLTEGTIVECVLKSPSSDPIAYQIRGAVIALRNEDSNQILVSMWKHMEAD